MYNYLYEIRRSWLGTPFDIVCNHEYCTLLLVSYTFAFSFVSKLVWMQNLRSQNEGPHHSEQFGNLEPQQDLHKIFSGLQVSPFFISTWTQILLSSQDHQAVHAFQNDYSFNNWCWQSKLANLSVQCLFQMLQYWDKFSTCTLFWW